MPSIMVIMNKKTEFCIVKYKFFCISEEHIEHNYTIVGYHLMLTSNHMSERLSKK